VAGADSADVVWRTSSWSGGTGCVEVAFVDGGDVLMRHSKDPQGPVLRFTADEWSAFRRGVLSGEF
jgi:Domain of unknown function (DUF397)